MKNWFRHGTGISVSTFATVSAKSVLAPRLPCSKKFAFYPIWGLEFGVWRLRPLHGLFGATKDQDPLPCSHRGGYQKNHRHRQVCRRRQPQSRRRKNPWIGRGGRLWQIHAFTHDHAAHFGSIGSRHPANPTLDLTLNPTNQFIYGKSQ